MNLKLLQKTEEVTGDLIGNKAADIYKYFNIIPGIASQSNPDITSQIKNQ